MDIHSTIERMLNMTVANGASVQEAETAAAAVRKPLPAPPRQQPLGFLGGGS